MSKPAIFEEIQGLSSQWLGCQVLGTFAYAAQTLALAFVDCPEHGKREALCGADISDVLGSMAIFVGSTLEASQYCDSKFRLPINR